MMGVSVLLPVDKPSDDNFSNTGQQEIQSQDLSQASIFGALWKILKGGFDTIIDVAEGTYCCVRCTASGGTSHWCECCPLWAD